MIDSIQFNSIQINLVFLCSAKSQQQLAQGASYSKVKTLQ